MNNTEIYNPRLDNWLSANLYPWLVGDKDPFYNSYGVISMYIVGTSIVACVMFCFNKKKKSLLLHRSNNRSGVSIFSLRIFSLISLLMVLCLI